ASRCSPAPGTPASCPMASGAPGSGSSRSRPASTPSTSSTGTRTWTCSSAARPTATSSRSSWTPWPASAAMRRTAQTMQPSVAPAVKVGREPAVEASVLHAPTGLSRISAKGPLLRFRSDDQLVALFRMGYDDAFGVIHDRYRPRLFAYTRQMLSGSRADAEDALQDVFLRAYSALRCDDRPVTLRAWLYRVAHNRCIDQLRRPIPHAADVADASRAPQDDPLSEAERREDLRRLVADVGRLPGPQRSALLMRELEGLSYGELADAPAVTVPAIKSL